MESTTNCLQILEHLSHNFVLAWIISISQGASVWTVYNYIYFYIFTYSWASLYIIISNYIFKYFNQFITISPF